LWNCFDEWHWSFNECFRGAKYAKWSGQCSYAYNARCIHSSMAIPLW
jgi:hypothetical protein